MTGWLSLIEAKALKNQLHSLDVEKFTEKLLFCDTNTKRDREWSGVNNLCP